MKFVETGKYTVAKYFDFWQERIVNKNQYYVKYRRDFTFDVLIFAEKLDGSRTYMARLKNAWPKMRSKINYDSQPDGEPVSIDITWEYEDLHTENLDVSLADLGIRVAADFVLDSGFEIANGIRDIGDTVDDIKDVFRKIF